MSRGRIFFFLCSCAILSMSSLSVRAQETMASDSLATVLSNMEEKMFAAIESSDASALSSLLSPDYVTITADGVMESRQEMLKTFGKFKGSRHTLSERKIRVAGQTVIVTGRAKFLLNALLVSELFYTEIWNFNKGSWQIISWQGTATGLPSLYPEFTAAILTVLVFWLVRLIVTFARQKKENRMGPPDQV